MIATFPYAPEALLQECLFLNQALGFGSEELMTMESVERIRWVIIAGDMLEERNREQSPKGQGGRDSIANEMAKLERRRRRGL